MFTSRFGAWAVLLALGLAAPATAQPAPVTTIVRVVGAQSGKAITDASVTIDDTDASAANRGDGTYVVGPLAAGPHRVVVRAPGFARAARTLAPGETTTVALARDDEATQLSTIGAVKAIAADSPENGVAVHTTLTSANLAQAGAFRLADALIEVPQLNATTTGYTAQANGPGSSIYLDIRGLGAIETLSTIDGHPIGQGIDLGYNYQNAPIFGLSDIFVGYGTGATGLSSYGTGGGAIDMRTIEPTRARHLRYLQGIGSYGQAVSAVQATGTTGGERVGYAFAYGVEGSAGQLGSPTIYEPTASWDPSAAGYRAGATYAASQQTLRRSAVGKLRLRVGSSSFVTVHGTSNWSTADGTGNSDNLYLSPRVALAQGTQRLKNKSASDPCPAGTFTGTNAFGIPNGTGRDFGPDDGTMCQTPQQYAQYNGGWQGYGPHRVDNDLSDYGIRFDTSTANNDLAFDAFTNDYAFFYDRTDFLPYFAAPGDTGFSVFDAVTNTGFTLSDRYVAGPHRLGILYRYLNSANVFDTTGSARSAPDVTERALAAEDRWEAPGSPLAARLRVGLSSSTATHTSFVDPHADLQYRLSGNDRLRLSGGSGTVQPPGAWIGLPFTPTGISTFSSSIDTTCTGTYAIGGAPSRAVTPLRPERAADADLAYTHDWRHGDFTTVDLYTEQLTNKIYDATVPLSALSAGAIDPAVVAAYLKALQGVCGTASAATLGATAYLNLARVQARGIEITGRRHLGRNLALGYNWSVAASQFGGGSIALLRANPTLVPGAQLPGVPLHKGSLRLQFANPAGFDAALTGYAVARNNPANLPAYAYANLELGVRFGRSARLGFVVDNLFNTYGSDRAYVGEGEPLALNAWQAAGAGTPLVGLGATTWQGLAPTRVLLSLQVGM